ncbi:MAG: type II secretion system protein GspD [bacterium]
MKNKYLLIMAFTFAVQYLLLNINFVYGRSVYDDKGDNLSILLKKYDVSLSKPKIIPVNINKKMVKRRTGRSNPNHISKYRHIYNKGTKKHPLAGFLSQKVSLAGRGSVKSALMLLSREIGVPVVIYGGFPDKLKNDAYYKDVPLYKVLKGLVISNGFKYSYKNGMLNVYAVEEKTFHIPVSDLLSSFSSTVGMTGMTGQNNNNNNDNIGNTNAPGMQGGQNTGGAQPAASGSVNSINSAGNNNESNAVSPNSSASLSLTLSESDSLYGIISRNIKEMLTKKGRYFVNPKDGLIWVKDRVSNVAEVSGYIKRIDKFLSKQVFLKVEVIDVSLNKGFQTGINWSLLFNQAFKSNAFGADSISVAAQLASGNNISNAPYIGFTGSGNSSAILNALKTQGAVNVISQPRLVLMDGQTRLISSGTITPYISSIQTMALSLSQTETYPVISQVQTGLSISFTPHINFKNNSVSVTLSLIDNSITGYQSFSISGDNFSNPVIESKSFSDTVNVKSGSTILVGGILTTDKSKNTYGIPILSKIPLIGDLFNSINDSSQKEDLLIMLTPKITL